jgi:NAD(P)H-hydrate epimerase
LGGDPRGQKVVVLAGTGGNGGGALVCARRLHNYGADVRVFVTRPDNDFAPVPGHQLEIVRRMGIPVALADELDEDEETATTSTVLSTSSTQSTLSMTEVLSAGVLIIDGLIGYSLQGSPRGTAADLINWANRQAVPILALDAPSGLDTATGTIFEPAIRATATMTLALPKVGLLGETAVPHVGELYLADISVPPELYAGPALQLKVDPLFAVSDIVRLR